MSSLHWETIWRQHGEKGSGDLEGYEFRQEGQISIVVLGLKKKKIYEASHEALASAPTHFSGLQSGPLLLKMLLWQLSCGPEETCLVMHM